MMAYFDDKTMSVIDIYNKIVINDTDFAITNLKFSKPYHPSRIIFDISAINKLKRAIY
jgi:hypothetical protein